VGILERIRGYIGSLEEKQLYRYMMISFGVLLIMLGLLIFYHYRKISGLRTQISGLNRIRNREVQAILSKADYVQKQLQEIDTLLSEDRNFKISEYFENVLKKLNLGDKFKSMAPPRRETQDQYEKSILDVNFDEMDMKQVAELLKEFEENRRIFVEKLEIMRSKKARNKLEVNMTIGTLLKPE